MLNVMLEVSLSSKVSVSSVTSVSALCKDILIFFFQAEDGIRDIGVTGVQTCALPIYPRDAARDPRRDLRARADGLHRVRGRQPRQDAGGPHRGEQGPPDAADHEPRDRKSVV